MTTLQGTALLCALRDALEKAGSWCGETHLQKAAYLLKEAAGVPLEAQFVLYKHGPFSFDLRETLTSMRISNSITLQPQAYPYGPRIMAGPRSAALQLQFADEIGRYGPHIAAVADLVKDRGVAALERLATALLLIRREPEQDDDFVVQELRQIKPHVQAVDARDAIAEIRAFLAGPGARLA